MPPVRLLVIMVSVLAAPASQGILPKDYCEDPAFDWHTHAYVTGSTLFYGEEMEIPPQEWSSYARDGNVSGDCNEDGIPADYDGHAEWGVSRAVLTVAEAYVEECMMEIPHHTSGILVEDRVLGYGVTFTVGTDSIGFDDGHHAPPGCDGLMEVGLQCAGWCAVPFPPGADGAYHVFINAPAFAGTVTSGEIPSPSPPPCWDSTDLDLDGQRNCDDLDDDGDLLADELEARLGLKAQVADSDGDGAPDGTDGAPKDDPSSMIVSVRALRLCHDGNSGPSDGQTPDDPYLRNPFGLVRRNADPSPEEQVRIHRLTPEGHVHNQKCIEFSGFNVAETGSDLSFPANLGRNAYPRVDGEGTPILELRSVGPMILMDHDSGNICWIDAPSGHRTCNDEGAGDDAYGDLTLPSNAWNLLELALSATNTLSSATMAGLSGQALVDQGGVAITAHVSGKVTLTFALGVSFSKCNILKSTLAALATPSDPLTTQTLNSAASARLGVSCA